MAFSAFIRVLFVLAVLSAPAAALAHVTRVEIVRREDVLGGRAFGLAGAYEKLVGRIYFAVDPANPRNQLIADLRRAPRNARGEVEFAADFYILRPRDPRRGNGAALLEIANRGGKGLLATFNRARGAADPSADADFGDGFLLRQGYTLVWVGWQFDVPRQAGLLRLDAPAATQDGRPITGLVRADFVVDTTVYDRPLADAGHLTYRAVDPAGRDNVLTVRDSASGARRVIPRREWSFARRVDGRPVPDSAWVHLARGFEPGRIYELVYRSADPPVAGLGFAAVRDLAAYLKHDSAAVAPVRTAIAFGISQSGRFLRHFVYQGFNADESGRRVFDGVMAHVAGGGRGGFNHRFAQPSRSSGVTSNFFFPNDLFPFTDADQTDPETGATDGLLRRSRELGVVPKLFLTNTSVEYYSRAGSLVHASPDGARDVPPSDSTRVYVFAGGQHVPSGFPPPTIGRHAANPNDFRWSLRALLVAMHRWTSDGAAPPPSAYPRVADSTLVPLARLAFPRVPGAEPPRTIHEPYRVDFGPRFAEGVIEREPPAVGRRYALLVPQVGPDGNELAGVKMPEVAAPLATYTGWSRRRPEQGFGDATVGLVGGWFPFPRTRAERERAGDPRPSVEERYRGRAEYLGTYAEAAAALVRDGYLLAEDVPALLEVAVRRWEHATR